MKSRLEAGFGVCGHNGGRDRVFTCGHRAGVLAAVKGPGSLAPSRWTPLWLGVGAMENCNSSGRCLLLATTIAALPRTPAGAFHATGSELSYPSARRHVRPPLSRNNPALQNDPGTLVDVRGGAGSGRRPPASLRARRVRGVPSLWHSRARLPSRSVQRLWAQPSRRFLVLSAAGNYRELIAGAPVGVAYFQGSAPDSFRPASQAMSLSST